MDASIKKSVSERQVHSSNNKKDTKVECQVMCQKSLELLVSDLSNNELAKNLITKPPILKVYILTHP